MARPKDEEIGCKRGKAGREQNHRDGKARFDRRGAVGTSTLNACFLGSQDIEHLCLAAMLHGVGKARRSTVIQVSSDKPADRQSGPGPGERVAS